MLSPVKMWRPTGGQRYTCTLVGTFLQSIYFLRFTYYDIESVYQKSTTTVFILTAATFASAPKPSKPQTLHTPRPSKPLISLNPQILKCYYMISFYCLRILLSITLLQARFWDSFFFTGISETPAPHVLPG